MANGGWTLIARFSNADNKNWVLSTGNYWYSQTATGSTTSPSINTDMISKAFYTVIGKDLKLSKSDNTNHKKLLRALNCLNETTFREKITSYGKIRNTAPWYPSSNGCKGSCPVTWENPEDIAGFSQYKCSGDLQSADYLSFWCQYSSGNGAVMMIGGGGSQCESADHGIAITTTSYITRRYDFGDDSDKSQTTSYALNLWIR